MVRDLVAQGLALFVGAFTLANVLGARFADGFDANLWWIDLRLSSHLPSAALTLFAALVLLAHGLRPARRGWRVGATSITAGVLAVVCAFNAVTFWRLRMSDAPVEAGPWVPFSVFPAAALALVALTLRRDREARRRPSIWIRLYAVSATAAVAALVAPLLLMATFGTTDYRRPADAVVVFGARAYADGTPSLSLEDRIRTGAQLVLDGYAPVLVASGGPGDGDFHEAEVMRRVAEEMGVPRSAIHLDLLGHSTADTVRNVAELAERRGWDELLAVSHAYHLPRIELTFHRAGLDAHTVPAAESRTLARLPYYCARESAALWAYWLAPLWSFPGIG